MHARAACLDYQAHVMITAQAAIKSDARSFKWSWTETVDYSIQPRIRSDAKLRQVWYRGGGYVYYRSTVGSATLSDLSQFGIRSFGRNRCLTAPEQNLVARACVWSVTAWRVCKLVHCKSHQCVQSNRRPVSWKLARLKYEVAKPRRTGATHGVTLKFVIRPTPIAKGQ